MPGSPHADRHGPASGQLFVGASHICRCYQRELEATEPHKHSLACPGQPCTAQPSPGCASLPLSPCTRTRGAFLCKSTVVTSPGLLGATQSRFPTSGPRAPPSQKHNGKRPRFRSVQVQDYTYPTHKSIPCESGPRTLPGHCSVGREFQNRAKELLARPV